MLTRMFHRYVGAAALLALSCTTALAQNTIHVPADQRTIQAGINAANTGDTVLVAPGTYFENIDFKGKAITVTSSGGAASTIIDGGAVAPTVTFKSSEPRTAVLSNITIQHGGTYNGQLPTGGIYVFNSSPTILNNTITQNNCWDIQAEKSAPLIQGNEISATQDPAGRCSFGGGAGIYIGGNLNGSSVTNNGTSPVILGNIIENNIESGLEDAGGNGGAAVAVWGGSPIIENNILRNNSSPGGSGGAINVEYGIGVAVVQNLIYGNSAGCGGGAIAFQNNTDTRTGIAILIANNTIVNNTGVRTADDSECLSISQIYPEPDSYGTSFPANIFINNIISGSTSYPAVNCGWFDTPSETIQPTFQNNILYNNGGLFFGSYCVNVSAKYNNADADPQFVDPGSNNYHLKSTSPAIDSGQNILLETFHNLTGLTLSTDLDGNPRIQAVTGKGCVIDMGAYEYPSTQGACSTAETINSSLNPSPAGATVTFTAQLSSATDVPTGDVQFSDGSTILGTEPISGTGASNFSTSLLSVGNHIITATYQPTGIFAAATAALTQVVTGYTTTTTLRSSLNPSTLNQPVTFTAHLTSTNGIPTGTITFTDASTPIGLPQTLDPSGNAFITTSTLTVGTHTITATYNPTGTFAASSASLTQTVNGLANTTTLTALPNTGYTYTPITLTATIAPNAPGNGTPTGTLIFYNGPAQLASTTLINGVATYTTTLPVGIDQLTAVYLGDATYTRSTSIAIPVTISASPSTLTLANTPIEPALTPFNISAQLSLGNGSRAGSGYPIAFAITPNTPGTTPGVTVIVPTNATGAASLPVSFLPGQYLVSASFAGTSDLLTATATSFVLTVIPNPTTTTLTASPNPGIQNEPITLTAVVSATNGTTSPTGTVTITDGTSTIATLTTSTSSAQTRIFTFTTSTLAPGTHTLTAFFTPTISFTPSQSLPLSFIIAPQSFTLTLTDPTLTLQTGHHRALTVTLTSIGGLTAAFTPSCGALPEFASCLWGQTSITLPANGTVSTSLTVDTNQLPGFIASNLRPTPNPGAPFMARSMRHGWAATAAFTLLPFTLLGIKRRRNLIPLLILAALATTLTACGANKYPYSTAPGTYTIPITATANSAGHPYTQTVNLTLIVTR
jgi:hypothetical protein